MRPTSSEILVMEFPDLIKGEPAEHCFGRKDSSIGVVPVEHGSELLKRKGLWLGTCYAQLTKPIVLESCQLAFRECGFAYDIGQQRNKPGCEF